MNTFIYAQGLPDDVTDKEIATFFKKCGLIKIDTQTGELKIKIYKDETGKPKGDCRVAYENIESVQMALEMLNDSEIRQGFPIKIELAQFQQKGETYKRREVKKIDKIEKLRIKAE